MKQSLRSILLGAMLVLGIGSASAQAFSSESLHLNAGIGIGGYLSYAYFGDFNTSPALFLAVDKGMDVELGPGTLGIGGFAAYKTSSYTYTYGNDTDEGRWTNAIIGARGTWHLNTISNPALDVYGALHLGLVMQSYKFESTNSFYDNYVYDSNSSFLYYSFSVGGKYFLTDAIGVFAELGWDIAYLKAGVAVNL
jgi:hypothetical protein